jgi:hypothetical protein
MQFRLHKAEIFNMLETDRKSNGVWIYPPLPAENSALFLHPKILDFIFIIYT